MPFRPQQEFTPFTDYVAPLAEPKGAPSVTEIWGAGFRLENDVLNAYDLLTRKPFEPDPTWDATKWLKENEQWDNRDYYIGARSQAEAESVLGRVRQEEHDRDVMERAGWAGVVAAMTAGMLSPTMLFPVFAGGRGAQAFIRAGVLGLGAGAAQELPLIAAQETRTGTETAINLIASATLGGLLGGAIGNLSRDAVGELTAKLSADMATLPGNGTIPQAAGAAAVRQDAGAFASAGGAVTASKWMSPVVRSIEQQVSPIGRWLMSQLSDAGMKFEKNAQGVAAAPMGTVENLAKTWYGGYAKAVRAIDENYLSFVYDGNVPGFAPSIRAVARGSLGSGEKSKASFREEIARAMRQGDQHENPYIQKAAQALRKEVYNPLLAEAQKLGLIPSEIDVAGDLSYLMRDYNRKAIQARRGGFVDKLAAHFERKYLDDFSKKADNFKKAMERDEELIQDIGRPAEEIESLRDSLTRQLEGLEESEEAQHLGALEETIAGLRAAARRLDGQTLAEETQRKQFLADARDMERSAGEGLAALRGNRRDLRRRLRNLNKAQVVLEERAMKKLDKIERMEELSLKKLRGMVKKVSTLLAKMDGLSDEAIEKEVEKLKGQFADAARVYDKGEERIIAEAKNTTDPEVWKLLGLDALQQGRAARLNRIAEEIERVEDFDREGIRAMLNDMVEESLTQTQDLIARRGARSERLRAQADALTPEELTDRIGKIRASRAEKIAKAEERFKDADYVDLTNGKADFAQLARSDANIVTDKILGSGIRMPSFDIMHGERGPILARNLDIPSAEIEEFLENDIERITKNYIRTVSSDIEMTRKFGSVNAERYLNPIDGELFLEERAALDNAEKALKITKFEKLKDKTGKTIDDVEVSPEELAKQQQEISDTYRNLRRDLAGVIGRLRHTWGLPEDPESIGFRLGRLALNLNVLRLMGGVTVSSIPDIGRPVMKYGLLKSLRRGFIPYIARMKEMEISRREVEFAGGALDVLIHSRAQGLFDIIDDVGRGTKFERGVEFATNKIGIVAAFDYWTREMKQITGVIANAEMMDSVRLVVEGGSKKELAKATEYLASLGIDGERAASIWQEVLEGGGQKVNGTWFPDTELWKNSDNVRAWRSALVRETDTTIITPGVERPLWIDKTMAGRMLGQFKSFAMSTLTRTMLAGMQQRDMAVVSGVATSLALGALSYYIYARLAGGDIEEEMLNADWDKWADEMIDRSGLLGPLSEVQNLGSRIPLISPLVSFSGSRTSKRAGGDSFMDTLMGPTWDLASRAADVITGIDEPTQGTLNAGSRLIPYQNLFYLRRLGDALKEQSGLPETRQ